MNDDHFLLVIQMVTSLDHIVQLFKSNLMRGNVFSEPYIISNLVSLMIIIIAIIKPVFARMVLSLIFIAAAVINTMIVLSHPEVYRIYASLTALPEYEDFINGSFSDYTVAYILAIAAGQLLIGLGLAWKGIYETIALAGAIIFLLAIAPLGAGSSFPCTVLLAIACAILLREKKDYPWVELLTNPGHLKRT